MSLAKTKLRECERRLRNLGIKYVRFEQSDYAGVSRSKRVPTQHFARYASKGLNFIGGILSHDMNSDFVEGTGFAEEGGYADHLLVPDLDTFHPIPWQKDSARVICDVFHLDGKTPVEAAPRMAAKKMLKELQSATGFEIMSGFEYEFYLKDAKTMQPLWKDSMVYATLRNEIHNAFSDEAVEAMIQSGVDVINYHSEYGPGQYEINWAPAWDIAAADHAFLFKTGIKEIAVKHGLMASFMTKPYIDKDACGCHIHQSLWKDGRNHMFDPNHEFKLSETARHWIAGQLLHAPALYAITAPTINCSKRFRPGVFAPTHINWGVENRTSGIRAIVSGESDTHIENRFGTSATNPYLAMAATIAAGLDGILNKVPLPAPTQGSTYHNTAQSFPQLPTSLEGGLAALEKDKVIKEALGPALVQAFTTIKKHEIAKAKKHNPHYGQPAWNNEVTAWETNNLYEFM
ncbi:Type I glutamate--ammonia ligase [Balamuthia mandrillaris]